MAEALFSDLDKCKELFHLHQKGNEIGASKADKKKGQAAVKELEERANNGDLYAQNYIVEALYIGIMGGGSLSAKLKTIFVVRKKWEKYLTMAALNPDTCNDHAKLSAVNKLASGFRSMGKYDKAEKWYEEAIKRGEVNPYAELGKMYSTGKKTNFKKAAEWYQKGIDAVPAARNLKMHLGVLYYKGKGVSKDHETAYRLLSEAAEVINDDETKAIYQKLKKKYE